MGRQEINGRTGKDITKALTVTPRRLLILDTRYSETKIIPKTDTADVMLEVVRYRDAFPASMCSWPMLSRAAVVCWQPPAVAAVPELVDNASCVVVHLAPRQQPHIST